MQNIVIYINIFQFRKIGQTCSTYCLSNSGGQWCVNDTSAKRQWHINDTSILYPTKWTYFCQFSLSVIADSLVVNSSWVLFYFFSITVAINVFPHQCFSPSIFVINVFSLMSVLTLICQRCVSCYFASCHFAWCYFASCYFASCYFAWCYFARFYFACCYFAGPKWTKKINFWQQNSACLVCFPSLDLDIYWQWLCTAQFIPIPLRE